MLNFCDIFSLFLLGCVGETGVTTSFGEWGREKMWFSFYYMYSKRYALVVISEVSLVCVCVCVFSLFWVCLGGSFEIR